LSTIEDKVKALNSYRILHVKLPVELFDLVMMTHRQDVDLFAALCFIRALENEGWIKKEVNKV
jgi:hypothetical protein